MTRQMKVPTLYRRFNGQRFELYQENPVRRTIADSVAEMVRDRGGKARVIGFGQGYYVVYARGMKG